MWFSIFLMKGVTIFFLRVDCRSRKLLGGLNIFHITSIYVKPQENPQWLPVSALTLCLQTQPTYHVPHWCWLIKTSSPILCNFLEFPGLVSALIFPKLAHTKLYTHSRFHLLSSLVQMWAQADLASLEADADNVIALLGHKHESLIFSIYLQQYYDKSVSLKS